MSEQFFDPDEDLKQCWQSMHLGEADPERLTREMRFTVASFDRKIFWRNAGEYLACAALLVWFGFDVWEGDKLAAVSICAVLFVMFCLWWNHRSVIVLDPSADLRSYQAALIERFDRQIRVLSSMKYWYLLPLYVSVMVGASKTWTESPVAAVLSLAIVFAAFVFVWWVNEVLGIRRLQQARAQVAEMVEADTQVAFNEG